MFPRLSLFLFGIFLVLIQPAVAAENPAIIISKISPIGSANHEWVEVKNTGAAPVDLANWKFWEAATNHGLKSTQGGTVIAPLNRALIVNDAETFLADHPSSTLIVFDSAWGSLSEDGEEIGLRNSSGTLVELITYPSAKDAPIAREDALSEWCPATAESAGLEWLCEEPAAEPPPETVAPSLALSEIYPYPTENEKEWVEIYNYGESDIDPDRCLISDSSGAVVIFESQLKRQNFFSIEFASSRLNNDGDSVRLLCDGSEIDSLLYGDESLAAPKKGWSLSRDALPAGVWRLSTTPTRNATNTISEPPPTDKTEARRKNVVIDDRKYLPGRLLINEIFPGKALEAWIEIHNPERNSISLAGWQIQINTESIALPNKILAGNDYLIIKSAAWPVGAGSGIALLIDPQKFTANQVAWGAGYATPDDNAPAATELGASIARRYEGYNSGNDADNFAVTYSPTPAETNEISDKKSEGLRFSEILADPSGPDELGEFVELQNFSSSTVDLAGWSIAINGQTTDKFEKLKIEPQAFATLTRKQMKRALPNSGAELELISPQGKIADQFKYGKTERGISFALSPSSVWQSTSRPTINAQNIIIPINHAPQADLEIRESETNKAEYIFDAGDSWDSDGSLARILWDFGDGAISDATSTVHVYQNSGKYRIQLSVFDPEGASSTKKKALNVPKLDFENSDSNAVAAAEKTAPAKSQSKKTTVKKQKTKKTTTAAVKNPIVAISGLALSESGVLGSRLVPLTFEGQNFLLEIPKNSPPIKRGDLLEARGKVGTRLSKPVFRAQSVQTQTGAAPTPAEYSAIDELESAPEYSLVKIEGEVLEKTSRNLIIGNDGELKIILPRGTSSIGALDVGAKVKISGVARRDKNNEIELLPRDNRDLELLASAPAKIKEPSKQPISAASAGLTGTAAGVLISGTWTAASKFRRRLVEIALSWRGGGVG